MRVNEMTTIFSFRRGINGYDVRDFKASLKACILFTHHSITVLTYLHYSSF